MSKPDIVNLHPRVCNVRVTFEGGCSLLIFFDLETTGFGIYQVQIIQFGCVAALSIPGQPLQPLGTYMSYVMCKMRFPEDVTALTGIKNWYHPESQLKGAPTLPEVNCTVQKKIIEWKKKADTIMKRKIYSQLVTWNGDSYDVPLWVLQTEEMQGKGAWAKMFLTPDTGIVAHTDLYRITPHIGFGPRSIKDIERYFKPPAPKN